VTHNPSSHWVGNTITQTNSCRIGVEIIIATGNWLQDENFEYAIRRNWTLLKFQKQKDIVPVAGWAHGALVKRRKLEEGFNDVAEFQHIYVRESCAAALQQHQQQQPFQQQQHYSSSSNNISSSSISRCSSSNSSNNAEMLKGKKRFLMLRVKKTFMNNMLLKKTRAKLWKGSWPKPGAELAALSLGSMEALEGVALQSTPEKRRVQVVGNEVGSTEKDVTLVKMQDRCDASPKQGLDKHKQTLCTNISKFNY